MNNTTHDCCPGLDKSSIIVFRKQSITANLSSGSTKPPTGSIMVWLQTITLLKSTFKQYKTLSKFQQTCLWFRSNTGCVAGVRTSPGFCTVVTTGHFFVLSPREALNCGYQYMNEILHGHKLSSLNTISLALCKVIRRSGEFVLKQNYVLFS